MNAYLDVTMEAIQTILVVDDDDVLRNRLEKAFTKRGLIVTIAGEYEQAIDIAARHKPDMAVLCLLYTSPSPRD